MLVNRSSSSRFALPQTSAEWEQVFARCVAVAAKVPLSTWQFLARFILVICLAVSLARLFWLVFPAPVIPAATVAIPPVTTHLESNNASVNIAQLKSLAVFGKTDTPKQEQASSVVETQVVDTRLNLVLVGVIASNDDSAARAIISSADRQDVYAIDAPLPVGNNVTLSKVMVDRVIINNNGQFESLWLYQNDPDAPVISRAITAQPQEYNAPVQQQMLPEPNSYSRQGPLPTPESRSEPADNPAVAEVSRNLSDVLAMSIQRENGQVIGYKIRPGRDAEKFRSLGLQTDDVVTAINGMPLTNPAKIMEVYKNMGNTTSASLEIRRGGSVITVDVVLQ